MRATYRIVLAVEVKVEDDEHADELADEMDVQTSIYDPSRGKDVKSKVTVEEIERTS